MNNNSKSEITGGCIQYEETEEIRALEERLLDPDVRASSEDLDKLLSDDFVEFGSSGRVYSKKLVIESLGRQLEKEHFSIYDFRAQSLGNGVVLATYRVIRYEDVSGKEVHSLRSSIWKRENGCWRMIFHQGTPMQDLCCS